MDHGIASIEATTRKAQAQFNRWLALDDAEKTPSQLVEMLGFRLLHLLDHLTIARSGRHVQYYSTRRPAASPTTPPINIKADVDLAGEFRVPSATSIKSVGSRSPATRRCVCAAAQAGGLRRQIQHRGARRRKVSSARRIVKKA